MTNLERKLPPWTRLYQYLQTLPPLNTEESILFRVLVQLLVIVGIIASDIAGETSNWTWAVPLSIIGAIWSWYRRKKLNIGAKFIIAISMIVMLMLFFGNLLANLNDTRLVLAQLLIQLQVLHSFDLPRRKDLGYSMVIGLILIGVAGTVSQTMLFAPCLLVFLAVALPTLVLDYRSRLGLQSLDDLFFKSRKEQPTKNTPQSYSPLSLRSMGIFFAVIVVIGLLIFALMPRFRGYQLQSFPVSGPESLQNQSFTEQNRSILNPGYQKKGSGNLSGQNKEKGPGTLDQSFYYGFNPKMNQNLRGGLIEKIVMRVRSQAPGFWRVMAFNHYTGQGWENSREKILFTLNRDTWNYRFFIPLSAQEKETRQVIQSYSLVSSLPNVIPALSIPVSVFFPTRQISIDTEGGLRSPTPLVEGLTYSVISQVPYRNRTLLNQASEDYPAIIRANYLEIPAAIGEKVKARALELLDKSPRPITTSYEKALYLAQSLKQQYSVNVNLPFFEKNEDLVEAFLFKFQGGYPDHFSTVLTVMLRSLGIPARLVVGFAPGQFNPFTGYYIVKNTDAHAMSEVYFSEYGWFAFDPIPGHDLIPPSFEEEEAFSVLKQFWNWLAGFLPSPVTSFLSILWDKLIMGILRLIFGLWSAVSGSLLGLFAGLLGAVGLGFLGWLGWAQFQKLQQRLRLSKLQPTEQVYQQMLILLKSQGYPKHPAQTPLEYAKACSEHYAYPLDQMIEEISRAYVFWRYGEEEQNVNYLRQQVQEIQKSLSGWRSPRRGNKI